MQYYMISLYRHLGQRVLICRGMNWTDLSHSSRFFTSPPVSSTHRPFRILGLQQIAVGSTSRDELLHLWVDILGLNPTSNYVSEKENVDEVILTLGLDNSLRHSIEIDLMVPLDENKSPKVHIPPLNHIGLWVDDLKAAVKWMTAQGVRFTPGGIRKGASGYDVTFIHPKANDEYPISGAGVLIELVQAPNSLFKPETAIANTNATVHS